MADHDVEKAEIKKASHASLLRMCRQWERDVPFPRAHLRGVAGDGDGAVLAWMYEQECNPARWTLATVLARLDMHEIAQAIKYRAAG